MGKIILASMCFLLITTGLAGCSKALISEADQASSLSSALEAQVMPERIAEESNISEPESADEPQGPEGPPPGWIITSYDGFNFTLPEEWEPVEEAGSVIYQPQDGAGIIFQSLSLEDLQAVGQSTFDGLFSALTAETPDATRKDSKLGRYNTVRIEYETSDSSMISNYVIDAFDRFIILTAAWPSSDTSLKGTIDSVFTSAAPAIPDLTEGVHTKIISEEILRFKDALGDSNAVYVAEIQNVGTKVISFSDISIDLEDTTGNLISATTYVSIYPTAINPGESAYICEPLLEVEQGEFNLDSIGKAALHFNADEHAPIPILPVTVSNVSLGMSYSDPKLIGRIKNDSESELTNIYVAAPIRSTAGSIQTVIFYIMESLGAGEEKGFEQSAIFSDPTADYSNSSYEIITYCP